MGIETPKSRENITSIINTLVENKAEQDRVRTAFEYVDKTKENMSDEELERAYKEYNDALLKVKMVKELLDRGMSTEDQHELQEIATVLGYQPEGKVTRKEMVQYIQKIKKEVGEFLSSYEHIKEVLGDVYEQTDERTNYPISEAKTDDVVDIARTARQEGITEIADHYGFSGQEDETPGMEYLLNTYDCAYGVELAEEHPKQFPPFLVKDYLVYRGNENPPDMLSEEEQQEIAKEKDGVEVSWRLVRALKFYDTYKEVLKKDRTESGDDLSSQEQSPEEGEKLMEQIDTLDVPEDVANVQLLWDSKKEDWWVVDSMPHRMDSLLGDVDDFIKKKEFKTTNETRAEDSDTGARGFLGRIKDAFSGGQKTSNPQESNSSPENILSGKGADPDVLVEKDSNEMKEVLKELSLDELQKLKELINDRKSEISRQQQTLTNTLDNIKKLTKETQDFLGMSTSVFRDYYTSDKEVTLNELSDTLQGYKEKIAKKKDELTTEEQNSERDEKEQAIIQRFKMLIQHYLTARDEYRKKWMDNNTQPDAQNDEE